MKDRIIQPNGPGLKSFMHTETKIGGTAKALLLFSLLTIPLSIGYFFYNSDEGSQRLKDNKTCSTPVMQERQDPNKDKDIPPKITKAKLQLESVDNIDTIRVVIAEKQGDRRGISYKYEWLKNDKPYGANEDNITGFKKGDKVDVKITPYDGKQEGQTVFLTMAIERVSLQIVENKTVRFDGKALSYQVKAIDPNGGALSYSLADAPKDMTIDSSTGIINWPVSTNEYGKHNVNVMIKSSSGAEAVYPLSIDMAKFNEEQAQMQRADGSSYGKKGYAK